MKLFVATLVALDAVNSAASMAWYVVDWSFLSGAFTMSIYCRIYKLFIDGWDDAISYETADWSVGATAILLTCIAGLAHFFFARRLHFIAMPGCITLFIMFHRANYIIKIKGAKRTRCTVPLNCSSLN